MQPVHVIHEGTCASKHAYATAAKAYSALRHVRKSQLQRRSLRKTALHVYRCHVCTRYHLGNDAE